MPSELLLPGSIDGALKNVTDEPTRAIGKTLADIWFLVMGGVSLAADKKRLAYTKCLDDFNKELSAAVLAIPPEKVVAADYQIIGPALEDAKYCADKQSLRNMFTNLISSSLNSDTADMVHPSFSGIIKQMSPLDAENLSILARSAAPVVEYRAKRVSSGYVVLHTNVFLENPHQQDISIQSISISSLARLGLIEISFDTWIADEKGAPSNRFYDKFSRIDQYRAACVTHISPVPEDGFQAPRDNLLFKEIEIAHGRVYISPLGDAFATICL